MKKAYIIAILLIVIIALPLAWYLGSPVFIDKEVNEENPFSTQTSEAVSSSTSSTEDMMKEEEIMNDTMMKDENMFESESQSPATLYSGEFKDADAIHKVSGTASVITDGTKTFLRFEDFQSTNGPDLKVYLAADEEASEYISLGELKGNVGSQNYELSNIDLETYDHVLIWCEQFSVLFGSAQLVN